MQNFFGDGSRYNIDIQYATQSCAGWNRARCRSRAQFRRRFAVHFELRRHPGRSGKLQTHLSIFPTISKRLLRVTRGEDVSKGGAVFLNEQMELVDLREKSKPGEATSPWYNAGIYAFRPSIFEFTAKLKPSPRGEYELTDAIRDLAQSGKKVKALELDWRMGRCARSRNSGAIESRK